jgi:chromosome segregation ATPase
MIIERIQVEEGFLDGLDLTFAAGLNVLIGPRGSGKTSIIELIRFCLGAPALTDKAAQNSREHALSILGSGKVTVTLNPGTESFTVNRSSEHWTKTTSAEITPPLILSQNEIESVGLDATGRLRLLDSIRPVGRGTNPSTEEDALLSYIRSQTEERRSTSAELQTVRSQLRDLAEQLKEAEALKKQHAAALASIEKATKETERLSTLSGWLAALSVRAGVYARTSTTLQQWQQRLQAVNSGKADLEIWPAAAASEDPLVPVRQIVENSYADIQAALNKITEAISQLRKLAQHNDQQILQYEEEARKIRRFLDTLKQGAGEIARRLAGLQEKAGQQSALQALEKTKVARLEQIQSERKGFLDQLEAARAKRFEDRGKLVARLNKELGPRIKISIERAGLNTEYASAIVAALRGSGLPCTSGFHELGAAPRPVAPS